MATEHATPRPPLRAGDEVFIRVSEGRRVTVEFERTRQILGYAWSSRTRRTYHLRPLALWKLMALELTFDKVRESTGGALRLVDAVGALIGPDAFDLPREALHAIWDAHCAENGIPKAQAREDGPNYPGPLTESSSESSVSPPSTSADGRSSA